MAKDPDNLAADFDTESTTGFLAEEDAFDRRMLWRLGSWGVAAVGAVIIAVTANQSALTLRRDQVAASDVARQAQQLQTLAKESHNETRRLASAIDTLNGDRDRLYSRVTTLEQGLDSVTGAIAKQPAAPPPTPAAAPATPPASANSAPAVAAPAVAAVATTLAAASDKPVATDKVVASIDSKAPAPVEKPIAAAEKPMAADKKPAAAASRPQVAGEKPSAPESSSPVSASAPSVASPMSAAAAAASTDEVKPAAPAPAATPAADKLLMASRDPAPNKATEAAKPPTSSDVNAAPIPPLVITPDPDSEVEEDAPKAQIQRTEFGVDLGTANSVNGLRALWRSLLKSKANAPLAALRPIIVIKENSNGLGMQLRLVAGPLNDAGTAARICAGLSLVQRTCETAIYDGQRLALNEPPAGAKPAVPHRRVAPRRAAAPPAQPVAEEKKPEPTSISSMFRRNSQ
ncbi:MULTISPECIES: hypothetical protein [unclassified Bradyrhizobium]|uniref:hypothetical protein n=1 Tax=unclassified Bradyrhizobium TaxID=2631580 RepID=UPI001BA4DB6A|nr:MULTISPECIES: hypothetical protein [unclassified Bradyrhizobium]MBR1206777.1 hypothetical protein [Bradyrhizobium sp. AUGA SZCCT0124]MBR1316771.1 hypothetical protein [Bradyrhizobium sp. AUGA SZCCT0051]MBR1344857.1 hypothetical protein [Bradyrhizobium sp. AUGA SZCCT0105]MBR1356347.1 hypothetical protein [Bradyrhizobium sp. AUGA SZCCT0045]